MLNIRSKNMENSNGSVNGSMKQVEHHQNGSLSNVLSKLSETGGEKRERIISLIIVYFTLFLQSLGLAIAMTGVWPFLDKVLLVRFIKRFTIKLFFFQTARSHCWENLFQFRRGGKSSWTIHSFSSSGLLD